MRIDMMPVLPTFIHCRLSTCKRLNASSSNLVANYAAFGFAFVLCWVKRIQLVPQFTKSILFVLPLEDGTQLVLGMSETIIKGNNSRLQAMTFRIF